MEHVLDDTLLAMPEYSKKRAKRWQRGEIAVGNQTPMTGEKLNCDGSLGTALIKHFLTLADVRAPSFRRNSADKDSNEIVLSDRACIGNLMKPFVLVPWLLSLLILPGCIHGLKLRSTAGETLHGRYRFAREDTGLMQVTQGNGEILSGKFAQVGRTAFVESYEKTFGNGSISVAGLDASPYGHLSGGLFGSSYGLTGSAYRRLPVDAPTNSVTTVKGPLFYWKALLHGDRGTTMACYFIGSSYTNHGFGSCKSHTGEEYSADF